MREFSQQAESEDWEKWSHLSPVKCPHMRTSSKMSLMLKTVRGHVQCGKQQWCLKRFYSALVLTVMLTLCLSQTHLIRSSGLSGLSLAGGSQVSCNLWIREVWEWCLKWLLSVEESAVVCHMCSCWDRSHNTYCHFLLSLIAALQVPLGVMFHTCSLRCSQSIHVYYLSIDFTQ